MERPRGVGGDPVVQRVEQAVRLAEAERGTDVERAGHAREQELDRVVE
ncbi:hypothetical protein OV079_19590 [Nannocystis pusilla]|uniref:Uncharacterized protein n=1 Tax=Nannocystis pusilla TaxID=889268 RepID=A0A9X3EP45_9BACT|nr:hypothetical protein [Nannocystis pusilla]MCY1007714.1 hypothetical protein [Nannocystis pusilla]